MVGEGDEEGSASASAITSQFDQLGLGETLVTDSATVLDKSAALISSTKKAGDAITGV